MNPDGLSYVDMASETLKSGPDNLVNGYWSPLYPALLAAAFLPLHADSGREFAVAHLVNFVIFLAALWTFSFFLRAWIGARDQFGTGEERADRWIILFGFCSFLWFTLQYVSERHVTPDLCVATVVFLAAGCCCRASLRTTTWKNYATLGFGLGVGYYAKAVMFPLALVLLALLWLMPPFFMKRRDALVAALAFAALAAPLVALTSKHVGRLSTGESGSLNYIWYVDGLTPFQGWTQQNIDSPQRPEHPPRVLFDKPLTLEFTSPVQGTYPLWYEPSYWYAGAKSHFDLRKQIKVLGVQARIYKQMLFEMAPFLSGAIVLACFAIARGRIAPHYRSAVFLIWPIAAAAVYALVHAERRFLGGFFLVFWVVLFASLMFHVHSDVRTAVVLVVLLTAMIPMLEQLVLISVEDVSEILRPRASPYETVVRTFNRLGIRHGDRLAIVGPGFGSIDIGGPGFESYDIRAAGARIVAEIEDDQGFWRMKPEAAREAERAPSGHRRQSNCGHGRARSR